MGSWWNWNSSMKLNADQETHPKYWCRLKNESCGWQHKVKMFWTNIRKRNKKTTDSWCAIHTFIHACIHAWKKKERERAIIPRFTLRKQTNNNILIMISSNGCKDIFTLVHIFFSQTKTFSFRRDIHWTYISFDLFADAFVCIVNPKYMCN